MSSISSDQYRARQTEADFQRTVVEAAHRHGWLTFHFPNAVINPAGWPDLLMLRNGVWRLRELKGERGRLGARQREMLETLGAAGADVAIWRADMWDTIVEELRDGCDPG